MRVKHDGIISYIDRKYMLNGRDFILDSIGKYFGIISGIILLIIALITFIINIIETRENHDDIKLLNKKVNQLELRKN